VDRSDLSLVVGSTTSVSVDEQREATREQAWIWG